MGFGCKATPSLRFVVRNQLGFQIGESAALLLIVIVHPKARERVIKPPTLGHRAAVLCEDSEPLPRAREGARFAAREGLSATTIE